jgi:hypothetical protein
MHQFSGPGSLIAAMDQVLEALFRSQKMPRKELLRRARARNRNVDDF